MYYTFRWVGHGVYECTKWEDFEPIPLDTYTITKKRAYKCDCPAHVPFCKHIDMLSEMIECDCIGEHWLWYFNESGWQKAHDFR